MRPAGAAEPARQRARGSTAGRETVREARMRFFFCWADGLMGQKYRGYT
jgi:hypothetical protein